MKELAGFMFNKSKYTNTYYRIINRAKGQARAKEHPHQYDAHHIIPRSLGGEDAQHNNVLLTPREHFVCHLLLIKMTSGKNRSKMIYAFFRFSPKGQKFTSNNYQMWIKTFNADTSGANNAFFGKHNTQETKRQISENHGMRGKSCYDIWLNQFSFDEANKRRDNMLNKRSVSLSGKNNPQFGKPRTQKQKETQSKKMTGASNPNFGKIWCWINKDGQSKRIEKHTLDRYVNSGWKTGRA